MLFFKLIFAQHKLVNKQRDTFLKLTQMSWTATGKVRFLCRAYLPHFSLVGVLGGFVSICSCWVSVIATFSSCGVFLLHLFYVCWFVFLIIMFPAFAAFGCLQRICASRSPQVTLLRHNNRATVIFLKPLKLLNLTIIIGLGFFWESDMCACVEALLLAGVYKGELELLTSLLSLSQTGFRAFICTVADCRFIMGCITGESNLFWSTGSQLSRQLKATASSHVSMATAILWPMRERHDPLFE